MLLKLTYYAQLCSKNYDSKYSKNFFLLKITTSYRKGDNSYCIITESETEDCCLFVNEICNREKTRSAAAEDGCTPEYCAELLHLLCSNSNLLCPHNSLMLLITYYAQNYASIICQGLVSIYLSGMISIFHPSCSRCISVICAVGGHRFHYRCKVMLSYITHIYIMILKFSIYHTHL